MQALRSYLDDECYPAFFKIATDEAKSFDDMQPRLKAEDALYLIFKCLTQHDFTQDQLMKLRREAHDRFKDLDASRVNRIEVTEPARLARFYECYARRIDQFVEDEENSAWSKAALYAAVTHGHIRYFIDAARAFDHQTKTEEEIQAAITKGKPAIKLRGSTAKASKYSRIMWALN